MRTYKIIDHEADIGFEVYGRTLEELFENAAHAVFSLIVDTKTVKPEMGRKLELEGSGELLIIFLNELLYLWDTEGFIPKDLSVKISKGKLTGNVVGELFDPLKHTIKKEIKAVTYHNFSIKKEGNMFKGIFILDI